MTVDCRWKKPSEPPTPLNLVPPLIDLSWYKSFPVPHDATRICPRTKIQSSQSSPSAPYSSRQLDILLHDGDALGVDGA